MDGIETFRAGPGRFYGNVHLTPVEDRFWKTTTITIWEQDNGFYLEIPEGFVFDGASIPRQAWTLIGHPMTGKYIFPSLLHDYECYTQTSPSKEVHDRFYHALRSRKVNMITARLMWVAVRAFGPRWNVTISPLVVRA